MEMDNKGKHCVYLKGASGVDSKTAQVPNLFRNENHGAVTD